MINNNFKNIMSYFLWTTNSSTANSDVAMVNTSGNIPANTDSRYNLYSPVRNIGEAGGRIVVGAGSTSPLTTDYKLVSQIDSLTYLNSSISIGKKDNNIMVITTTYVNNTTEPVIVSEIGFLTTMTENFLLAREVISPISIGVGETYTFTMTIG